MTSMEEGKETPAFWSAIGGKGDYPLMNGAERCISRMFQCSVATGEFAINEVVAYSQVRLVMSVMTFEAVV